MRGGEPLRLSSTGAAMVVVSAGPAGAGTGAATEVGRKGSKKLREWQIAELMLFPFSDKIAVAAAVLLKSRRNVGDSEWVNLKALRVVLAKHAAPVCGCLIEREFCLGRQSRCSLTM